MKGWYEGKLWRLRILSSSRTKLNNSIKIKGGAHFNLSIPILQMGKSRTRVLAVCPRDRAVMSHPGSSSRALVLSEAELSFSATFQGLTFLAPQRNTMDEREKRQKQEVKSEDNWEKMKATWVKREQWWVSRKKTIHEREERKRKKSDYSHTHRAKHRMLPLEVLPLHAWQDDWVIWSGQAA